ncbi:hypothetical protein [Streptomyces sp. NPDC006333]|uniref:hypothetical protein n=1 Tax=Streptomyces sp. NPDC006333 TaxID=3156753 RepID=UPI0033B2295C
MDPKHTRDGLPESEAAAEARRLIEDWARASDQIRQGPTSFRDPSPVPAYGSTPPVPQPDRRIVPAWAAGTAVAGIGVGATFVGVGCGIWLACQGFAAVTLTSVLFVTLPIAAVAGVVAAIASAVRSMKDAHIENHHHYEGPVTQDNSNVHTQSRGLLAWTRNDVN